MPEARITWNHELGEMIRSRAECGSLSSVAITAVSATSSPVLLANWNRSYLFIQNLSNTNALFLDFGQTATLGAGSIKLSAGASWVSDNHFIPIQQVHVRAETGTIEVTIKFAN